MRAEDIFIDKEDNFPKPEVLPKFGARRCNLRPRFPLHQAGADARTRTIDRGIQNTNHQQG